MGCTGKTGLQGLLGLLDPRAGQACRGRQATMVLWAQRAKLANQGIQGPRDHRERSGRRVLMARQVWTARWDLLGRRVCLERMVVTDCRVTRVFRAAKGRLGCRAGMVSPVQVGGTARSGAQAPPGLQDPKANKVSLGRGAARAPLQNAGRAICPH